MKPTLFFKIVTLIAALVFVLIAIRSINAGSVGKFFAALGIEPGTQSSPGLQPGGSSLAPGEERFNICRTRIVGVRFVDGRQIVEEKNGFKMRWMAVEREPREIGYLDVEKWLSRHCQITIRPAGEMAADAEKSRWLEIRYVDGSLAVIHRVRGGVFDFSALGERRAAASPELESAVAELLSVAQMAPLPPQP